MDISVGRNVNSYAYRQPLSVKQKQCTTADKQGQYSAGDKGKGVSSLFDKYLNAKVPISDTNVVDVTYDHFSPALQLFHDWSEWKQGQQDADMPDASSSMEEKLAYVRKRYGDASDALTIYDALNTMKDLGIISQTEYIWSEGGPGIHMTKEEMEEWINSHSVSGDLSDEHWHGKFMTSPLVGFHSLDDIFNWLEEFRKEDHPLTVSLEEARRMGITRL